MDVDDASGKLLGAGVAQVDVVAGGCPDAACGVNDGFLNKRCEN